MKIGFHSPLPPARTGVADYSASLLPALRAHGSVEIAPAKADVRLYHIANNVLHRDIYERALAEPGVVVLHDALLQHLFMGSLTEPEYVEEFVYNYGEWSRDVATDLWRGKSSSGLRQAYYEYPMLKRLTERSRAVVVHNPAAARIVRSHAPQTPVIEIPHLFCGAGFQPARRFFNRRSSPGHESPLLPERQRLPNNPAAYIFGIFGYLRESKRIATAIRAYKKVRAARPNTALLLAGDFISADLARAVKPLLDDPGVIRIGHMTEPEFWQTVAATDACINLRFPSAGETSGIEIRLMGAGKPVLVSNSEETARYPETACLRVDTGLAEEEMLAEYMLSLRLLPGLGAAVGDSAAEHIRRWHSIERVAGLYWETLCAFSQNA